MRAILPLLVLLTITPLWGLTACAAHAAPPVATSTPDPVPAPIVADKPLVGQSNILADRGTWMVSAPGQWDIDENDDAGFKARSHEDLGRGPITLVVSHDHFENALPPKVFASIASSRIPAVVDDRDSIVSLQRSPMAFHTIPAVFTSILTEDGAIILGLSVERDNDGFTILCIADAQAPGSLHTCTDLVTHSLEI